MPRFTCDAGSPFTQAFVPVLRNTTLTGADVWPGSSVGHADSLTQVLWKPESTVSSRYAPSSSRCVTPSSTGCTPMR